MSYRIGLNAHLLSLAQSYRGAGINGYIYQLLRHLPAAGGSLGYRAYFSDPAYCPPAGIAAQRTRCDTRSPWRRILWEQTCLAWLSRGLDLLHGLAFASPLAAACPTVVTVHDLSFLRYPAAFRRLNRFYLGWITRLSVRRAARVIAVSESTRRDVIEFCGACPERVVVVPNGVTPDFCPANPAATAEFRERRGLPERYILFLGTLEPRKNLVRLVDAYADWRAGPGAHGTRNSRANVKLVLAGGKGWYYDEIFARVVERGLTGDVIFPGFIPGDELPWWYRGAELFVYPSLFEGFGLPVLEAMASGVPTIATAASSLPEVAGDAAVLVPPDDTAQLALAIGRVLGEPALAAELRRLGPERAAAFSWQNTARATARLYEAVLGGAA